MQRSIRACLLAAALASCLVGGGLQAAASEAAAVEIPLLNKVTTLTTIALIMGEPNFAMDGGYQELEEGLYTSPELKPGNHMFAPVHDIFELLGGRVSTDTVARSISLELNGHQLRAVSGSAEASLDGLPLVLELAPELRGSTMWLPLEDVFRAFGAYTKWEPARQRFSATLIMPASKKTQDLAKGGSVTEATMTAQAPAFYASEAGRTLADVVLAYQNADGGWPKLDSDVNMLVPLNTAHLTGVKAKSTIDNDSTMKQIRVLARAYTAFHEPQYLAGFNRGIDYILAAQLANGGWQQFWPAPEGYKRHITFNDNAIVNVLDVLRDVLAGDPEFTFVDAARRARIRDAFDRGLALVLKTQLVVGGRKTGWCAQYDEITLAPEMGRAFELASISGHESVGVVRFLMSLEAPSPLVIDAVQNAVAWFSAARMPGVKRVRQIDRTLEMGFDYVLQQDPQSPGLWARFYDLDSGAPLFTARDSVRRSHFAEVSYERRVKYNWFTEAPRDLLASDYPLWQQRWAPQRNVLQ